MKNKMNIKHVAGLLLIMVAALISLSWPSPILAADADNDGFTDLLEQEGLTFTSVNPFVVFPTCIDNSIRNACVDPNSPDLFVILVPGAAVPSLLPDDPLAYIAISTGFGVHLVVGNSQTSRTVTTSSTQKALKITEDNTSALDNGNTFGVSTYGTPNDYDEAKVYSRRIKTFFENTCGSATKVCLGRDQYCVEKIASTFADFVKNIWQNHQLKNTIAHEAGHMKLLTAVADRKIGYHYATGTGVLLDQFIYA